ncbi:hypothetical protein GCM10028809_65530 [Spirosoma gilvum]
MVIVGVLTTVIIGINAWQTVNRLTEMNNWVVHTHQVLSKTQRMLALLTNMDNDLRGYLLSNNLYFKSDFENTSHEMNKEIKAIQVLTVDNAIQEKRLKQLDDLFQAKVERSRSLFVEGAITPGMARLDSIEHFLSISNNFNQVLKEFDSYENVLLETRVAQSERSASYATISNLVGAAVALLMIIGAIYLLYRSLKESNRLNQKLTESEQQTKKLLEAVPVPIVIIDREGKFYYANQAATQLFGDQLKFGQYTVGSNADYIFRFPDGQPYPAKEKPTYRALQGEKVQVDDLEIRLNGKAIQLLSTATPVNDAQGNLQYVITSSIDISDRVQSQHQLQEAKKLAEKAAKLKQDFLANMSHEIRTPLNAMLGFSELMETTSLDADQREYIGLIRTSGKNLLTIVNDILDLSKLEAGMIKLESIPFSIQMLVASLRAMCQVSIADKGLQLVVKLAPDLPTVLLGDPTRLTQILLNLLNNAIKFTKQGTITLQVEHGEGDVDQLVPVRFVVEDTGIGIDANVLPTIFDRFQQADDFTTRYYGGTGLGLSIVKALSELQGGTVHVTSTFGKGSRFVVEIPYTVAPEQTMLNQPDSSALMPISENVRVLVVEDNLMNQKLAIQVLKRLGYQVQVADNGQKALTLLETAAFDIILMDLQMPVMDGYETTRQIRSKLKSSVPIIAMTAHALPSEQEECIKVGMNDFLSKPFQLEELQLLMRKYVSTSGSVQKLPLEGEQPAPASTSFSMEPLLQAVGNDMELATELIEIYLAETPAGIENLQQALDQQDVDTIKQIIHTQQVHTKMLGMHEATRLILETEALIREKKGLVEVAPLVEQYIKEVQSIIPQMSQYIQTGLTSIEQKPA